MLKHGVWQIWHGKPHLFQTTPGVANTFLGRGRVALSCVWWLFCSHLCNRRRAISGAVQRGKAIARSLNVGFGQAALLVEIAAQRSVVALLVVATRQPIIVPPGAIGSGVANRDELATTTVA